MGVLRKVLFVIWAVIYMIIPLTEFGYGVNYSGQNVICPIVNLVAPCLIGVSVTESILLLGIFAIVFLHHTNSGTTVHTTIETTNFSDGSKSVKETSWSWRGLAYIFTFIVILVTAGLFFALHQVFAVQSNVQFTDRTASTYCERELYQAAFGLLIASYIVGTGLLIFGIVIYNMGS